MSFNGQFSKLTRRLESDSGEVWEVHDQACALAETDPDVLLLSVGDPDLNTHPDTVNYAISKLQQGRTHYAPGMGELDLRQTIANIEHIASNRPCDANQVLIFPGATNAIYSVMCCLLNPGDDVITAEPMYIGYHGIFNAIGANIITVALDIDNNFALDIHKITAAVTPKTKVIFINTPGNPTGNIIPASQLKTLAKFCYDHNIWLVSDEVYSMITYRQKHVSLRTAAEHLDNIITIDGLSKSHAMTGWRLGWAVAPEYIIERLLNFTSSTIFGCCQFVQDAAAFALKNDADYMNQVRQEYKSRRDFVCQRLNSIARIRCKEPDAGMFVMADISAIAPDGKTFARQLLAAQKVSVLPGIGFGKSTEHYVRISLAQPIEVLSEALNRIEIFIETKK